jgi:hypothetical protein
VEQGHQENDEARIMKATPHSMAYPFADVETCRDYDEEVEGNLAQTHPDRPVLADSKGEKNLPQAGMDESVSQEDGAMEQG